MELSPHPPHVPGRAEPGSLCNLLEADTGFPDEVTSQDDAPTIDGFGNGHTGMDHEQPRQVARAGARDTAQLGHGPVPRRIGRDGVLRAVKTAGWRWLRPSRRAASDILASRGDEATAASADRRPLKAPGQPRCGPFRPFRFHWVGGVANAWPTNSRIHTFAGALVSARRGALSRATSRGTRHSGSPLCRARHHSAACFRVS